MTGSSRDRAGFPPHIGTMRTRVCIPLCLALLVSGGGPAAWATTATDAARRLEGVERRIEVDSREVEALEARARAEASALEAVRAESIAAARAVQDHEEAVSGIEGELDILRENTAVATADLARRHLQLVDTLGALARLARQPPEAVLAMPRTPIETVRTALLLREIVPPLEHEADTLRAELAELADMHAAVAEKRTKLTAALTGLRRDRARLAALVDRKGKLLSSTEREQANVKSRLEKMAGEARTLQELLTRLEAERRAAAEAFRRAQSARDQAARDMVPSPQPPPERATRPTARPEPPRRSAALTAPQPRSERPITRARGALVLPVRGGIVQRFGEGVSPRDRGIALATRDGAQVVAPHDGRIAYAGQFRGYGLLLIIDHGEGYHSLLTGLERLGSVSGQWVLAGEPVGVMGTASDGQPHLYMELRLDGQPVNPLPWLAAQKG